MERPLRFCMITTFYPPYNFGGDGIFVHRLANELAQRGHRVDVVHCIDAYRLCAQREPEGSYTEHPNVTVHGLKSSAGLVSPLATHQTGSPLFKTAGLQEVLAQGFDVVHYHNVSLLGPKVLTYGKGIKLYTMHEFWLVCPTHVLFRFNQAPCERPRCLECTLTYRRPPQWWRYGRLLQQAARHVDAFIAPSRFSRDKHRQMGFDAPIVHLPNFVPAAVSSASASGPSPAASSREPYFLFVGRLEKVKGPQTLIPAFARYRQAQLWIAGAGSYEPHLRRLAGETNNVRFLGHVVRQHLRALYHQAIAVIVPSICFEVFALVIPEAFKERTPVIVRNLGGMPELVSESGGGLIYETEAELVAAMDYLMAHPAARHAMGARGYQAFERLWTAEAHLKRYFELIRTLAAGQMVSSIESRSD